MGMPGFGAGGGRRSARRWSCTRRGEKYQPRLKKWNSRAKPATARNLANGRGETLQPKGRKLLTVEMTPGESEGRPTPGQFLVCTHNGKWMYRDTGGIPEKSTTHKQEEIGHRHTVTLNCRPRWNGEQRGFPVAGEILPTDAEEPK